MMEELKKHLRQEMKAKRGQLSGYQVLRGELLAVKALRSLPEYNKINTLLVYMNIGHEVSTQAVVNQALRDGKTIGIPKVIGEGRMEFYEYSKNRLRRGKYGIIEPDITDIKPLTYNAENQAFIIVPGLAFDKRNNRLGYGGGYYDRFMAKNKDYLYAVGLCYDFQIVPDVPIGHYDVPLDQLVMINTKD